MSRNTNTRRNQPATPVRIKLKTRPQRRDSDVSSSIDLSDDDGYSAVEEISDDEDDDEDDVAAVEEENILNHDETPKVSEAPRPQWQPDEEDDEDDDDDDQYEDNDSQSWNGIETEQSQSDFFDTAYNNTVERHVRFDVPSSDSDSTETEDDHADLFPDIFVSQTSLDPAFRRELENDQDESSTSETFWEYQGTYEEAPDSDAEEAAQHLSKKDVAAESLPVSAVGSPSVPDDEPSQELDGYETDGDTTDEEDIPEPLPRRRTRRPSQPMSEDSDSEIETIIKPQRGHPRSGRFRLDRSDKKPIAILNPVTRKMMIFTPHKRRQLDLSPEHFDFSQWGAEEQSSPLLSNSANLMLSAMFPANGLGDFGNLSAMGPAEAFFPSTSDNNTPDESSSTHGSVPEEDEAEKKLTFEDFIAWGDCESSDDDRVDPNWQPSSTPLRPTTAGSENDVLSHLNSETVGAFRRNQINQQLILSRQATHDSLAFSGPLNYTTIKGLKSDRFDTAGMPLTPVRRHKKQASDMAKSPLEAVSAKRKASGEASGHSHKRPNSISAVNNLRL